VHTPWRRAAISFLRPTHYAQETAVQPNEKIWSASGVLMKQPPAWTPAQSDLVRPYATSFWGAPPAQDPSAITWAAYIPYFVFSRHRIIFGFKQIFFGTPGPPNPVAQACGTPSAAAAHYFIQELIYATTLARRRMRLTRLAGHAFVFKYPGAIALCWRTNRMRAVRMPSSGRGADCQFRLRAVEALEFFSHGTEQKLLFLPACRKRFCLEVCRGRCG